MFRFVKMNMPEPRLVVENFGGFVVVFLAFAIHHGGFCELEGAWKLCAGRG